MWFLSLKPISVPTLLTLLLSCWCWTQLVILSSTHLSSGPTVAQSTPPDSPDQWIGISPNSLSDYNAPVNIKHNLTRSAKHSANLSTCLYLRHLQPRVDWEEGGGWLTSHSKILTSFLSPLWIILSSDSTRSLHTPVVNNFVRSCLLFYDDPRQCTDWLVYHYSSHCANCPARCSLLLSRNSISYLYFKLLHFVILTGVTWRI